MGVPRFPKFSENCKCAVQPSSLNKQRSDIMVRGVLCNAWESRKTPNRCSNEHLFWKTKGRSIRNDQTLISNVSGKPDHPIGAEVDETLVEPFCSKVSPNLVHKANRETKPVNQCCPWFTSMVCLTAMISLFYAKPLLAGYATIKIEALTHKP